MAKGNQFLNGYCALFVDAPNRRKMGKKIVEEKLFEVNNGEKNQKRQKSPNRFVRTVTIAPLIEDQFM